MLQVEETWLSSEVLEVMEAKNEAEDEHESSPELAELSALEYFSSALQNVQGKASAGASEGPRKHVHAPQYHGKSKRTIRRHKKAKRDLEAQGFFSVAEFFKQKVKSSEQEDSNETVVGNMSGGEGGTVLIPACAKEVEVMEVETEAKDETSKMIGVHRFEEEEEEEMANKTEDGTKKTTDACSVEATSGPSRCHSSDRELSCWHRGPSRLILYESKESESESSCSETTQSNLEDLHSTDTRELEDFHCGVAPNNSAAQQASDNTVDLLQDCAGLRGVHNELALKARLGNLDTVLCGHIMAMVTLLNLFLDESLGYTWRQASEVVAKSEGHRTNHTWSIQQWTIHFAHTKELPTHQHSQTWLSVLNDKTVTHAIKEALGERAKSRFLTAADVMEVVSGPDIQGQLAQAGIFRPSIAKSTACCWLGKLGWQHGKHQNRMYVDGHEREDVVKYRSGFVD
jgi:hypothetical protein